jgi:hypothetical protein
MCAGGHQTTQFFRLKVLAPYRFLCKMSFHVDWGHEVDTKAGVVYHIYLLNVGEVGNSLYRSRCSSITKPLFWSSYPSFSESSHLNS